MLVVWLKTRLHNKAIDFSRRLFTRACKVLHQASTEEHTRWLGHPNVKYIQLRVDQRTGDFVFQDADGKHLDGETIYEIFPELKD